MLPISDKFCTSTSWAALILTFRFIKLIKKIFFKYIKIQKVTIRKRALYIICSLVFGLNTFLTQLWINCTELRIVGKSRRQDCINLQHRIVFARRHRLSLLTKHIQKKASFGVSCDVDGFTAVAACVCCFCLQQSQSFSHISNLNVTTCNYLSISINKITVYRRCNRI